MTTGIAVAFGGQRAVRAASPPTSSRRSILRTAAGPLTTDACCSLDQCGGGRGQHRVRRSRHVRVHRQGDERAGRRRRRRRHCQQRGRRRQPRRGGSDGHDPGLPRVAGRWQHAADQSRVAERHAVQRRRHARRFSSRGPGPRFRLKPDIAAPGYNITSAQTGHDVHRNRAVDRVSDRERPAAFSANSQTLSLNGTSMATPHVAGVMALLRQLHPDWSVEQLKALAMNTATHDVTMLPGWQRRAVRRRPHGRRAASTRATPRSRAWSRSTRRMRARSAFRSRRTSWPARRRK